MTKTNVSKFSTKRLNQGKTSGFTLIEVMIALAIIGILSAIATPMILDWLPNMRVRAAARDLYSSMQKIRMEAVRSNHEWAIVFDPPNNSYQACSDPGADNNWTTLADNTVTDAIDLTTYGSGIAFGHGNITGNNSVTSEAFPGDDVSYTVPVANVLIMNAKGIGSNGYIYLENENQDDTVYAVGTLTSGSILLRRWMGGGTWE